MHTKCLTLLERGSGVGNVIVTASRDFVVVFRIAYCILLCGLHSETGRGLGTGLKGKPPESRDLPEMESTTQSCPNRVFRNGGVELCVLVRIKDLTSSRSPGLTWLHSNEDD